MRHLTGSDITQINCPTGEERDYARGGDALSLSISETRESSCSLFGLRGSSLSDTANGATAEQPAAQICTFGPNQNHYHHELPPTWTILATVVSFRGERGELTDR
ncbi:hypothetical protein ALC56_05527 [Trachymyrmex septentrionalis]|uniref:Uncharacterized protein n=1 Tax=Trachymyrmex septentrionalis TaxID=34720 RepID=A0A151JY14_9HYME|nr:hypothetical protein ALC56_05527 [Trachymyrmex septentrionalis]